MNRHAALALLVTSALMSSRFSFACESCDKPRAVPNFSIVRPKAEAGDPEAQTILASAYRDGLGVTNDNTAALQWFQKAAAQNYAPAQYSLGMIFNHGRGVEKSVSEAVRWFHKSANQGYLPARLALAGKFRQGEGAPRDLTEAYKWYTLAGARTNRTVLNMRSFVAEQMNKRDVAEGERRAAEFSRTNKAAVAIVAGK